MWFYRVLFAFDALIFLVLGYFFLDGLQYGPSAETTAIWLPILGLPIVTLVGASMLRANGKTGLASLLLGLLALPPMLFIAFYGILFASGASWH